MPEYVKNHVVPAALLKGFTASNGRLCAYRVHEKRWLKNQLPENVALQSRFYWVEGAKDPSVLEKGLASDVDGPAASVFGRLRESPRLPTREELRALMVFVAFQMVRVPLFREWHRQRLKVSTPDMLEEEVTRKDFEDGVKLFGDPGVTFEEWKAMVRTGKIPVALSKNEELQLMIDQANAIIPWLMKRNWSVRVVPVGAPELVSSDLPVKTVTQTEQGCTVSTSRLAWPNTELVFAVSKHLLLHGRPGRARVADLSPAAIRDFNFATAWDATQIFASEPTLENIASR